MLLFWSCRPEKKKHNGFWSIELFCGIMFWGIDSDGFLLSIIADEFRHHCHSNPHPLPSYIWILNLILFKIFHDRFLKKIIGNMFDNILER